MSTIFPNRLRVGNVVYSIYSYPLEPFLDALPTRPEKRSTINTVYGYVATWEAFEGRLYLVDINSEPHLQLFAKASGPIVASWFSGLVCGWRGQSRKASNPPRRFWNEQIVLDIVNGEIVREWVLDLRDVPDQTGAELDQSLPAFLMKPR
ncbi:hypothetical protein ACFPOU_17165 [Massilia jejuensis]|uniref:Uncharacterized protein n=1 Tax=Massilia jejuensis TaxID=648894 RepID=A0ABW0PK70_9BURK